MSPCKRAQMERTQMERDLRELNKFTVKELKGYLKRRTIINKRKMKKLLTTVKENREAKRPKKAWSGVMFLRKINPITKKKFKAFCIARGISMTGRLIQHMKNDGRAGTNVRVSKKSIQEEDND